MVESDSYGSDHFPIVLTIGVSLPDALPRWNFYRADWVDCSLMFYVILPKVVCQEPRPNRRNAVSLGLIRNAKTQ